MVDSRSEFRSGTIALIARISRISANAKSPAPALLSAALSLSLALTSGTARAGLEITGKYQSKRAAGQVLTPASLQREIESAKRVSFEVLLTQWEIRFGARAALPLLEVASARSRAADPVRYTALMGAARLGGAAVAPRIAPFLRDKLWMMRSGALRALAGLGDTSVGSQTLPLLRDPALVVRLEAVQTVRALKPEGATTELLKAIEDPANYHGGKAQWVPPLALTTLGELSALRDASALARLKGVLARISRKRDPKFHRELSTAIARR